jgi:mannan endo-1,4-beta-mannosidase
MRMPAWARPTPPARPRARLRRPLALLSATLCGVVTAFTLAAAPAAAHTSHGGGGFVSRHGSTLTLDHRPFRFAGSNNYYLMYKSRPMVDDVFADASAAGFTVLRTWGWLDIGDQDGGNSVSSGKADGVYFQYWDGAGPAYNDGADGLEHLDYVLYRARRAGIRLVIPFTNNWSDFGGMDQYVRWRGGVAHDDFYTDETIRGWYKGWISHLLNRVNTLTGVRYKDDPTVMAWELANEPRCKGSGGYPASSACTSATLTAWADEMTRYIKSIDHRHLVGVGDEGFTCAAPGSGDWTANCGEGVDNTALTALPAVDLMSFHLYPDGWGKTAGWGTQWITDHIRTAHRLHKAVLLGEFGYLDKATRNPVYQQWTDAVRRAGGNGWLYWILSGDQDDGTPYPDYDGFTVYCPSPVCRTLTNGGTWLTKGPRPLPPVADHDTAVTEFGAAATLTPAANDVAYHASVRPSTLDLDPATPGRQDSVRVTGGSFAAAADGTVTFTPADGFTGKATAHYTIRDTARRVSNTADLTVTVKPSPTAPITLSSFEDGVEGWAPGDWQANAGTVAQTTGFHTDGAHGLHVDAADGGWFGRTFDQPVDLTGKTTLRYDLRTAAAGTSTTVALQVGPDWTWCQGPFTWVPENTAQRTLEIDLLTGLSCDGAQLNEVHGVLVYLSPGAFDIDDVRAE